MNDYVTRSEWNEMKSILERIVLASKLDTVIELVRK